MLGHHRPASETPFKWCFAGADYGPFIAVFESFIPINLKKKKKKKKNLFKFGPPLTKLSGSVHSVCLLLDFSNDKMQVSDTIFFHSIINDKNVWAKIKNFVQHFILSQIRKGDPVVQALISVQALVFYLAQLTCQKRFDCRNAILGSSAILLGTSYS